MSKFLDPFSVPAQLNNVGVLVVAYVARQLNSETMCIDASHLHYLHFIFYGSTVVCGGTFLLTILYFLGIVDFCINKICPCGEVCLTLNTLGIFLVGTFYHFVATIYGVLLYLLGNKSPCIELEMFKRITGLIYLIWFIGTCMFIGVYWHKRQQRNNISTINDRFIDA